MPPKVNKNIVKIVKPRKCCECGDDEELMSYTDICNKCLFIAKNEKKTDFINLFN
jgi:NMD protein affecting ribosome stability and mRNA decay